MSIIYGILEPEGAQVRSTCLSEIGGATAKHAPDGSFARTRGRVGMALQARHTHARSRLETWPATDCFGNMVTIDGRIDNHKQLAHDLDLSDRSPSDSELLLSSYVRWGERCFERLLGDWAVALWAHAERTLFLARDHAGTRTLYLQKRQTSIRWSTFLDTFLANGDFPNLSIDFAEAYIAGIPAKTMTPFVGVEAIPPGQYVRIAPDRISTAFHWRPLPKTTLRYSSDLQYEEQFLELFGTAVARRIGERAFPAVAELSGGMDSSSIVCVADRVSEPGILQTLSYFDDAEPNWNERPFFSIVEERRGRIGLHFEMSFADPGYEPVSGRCGVSYWPGLTQSVAAQRSITQDTLEEGGYRSIISGIGGDELLGGVPSSVPELANYVASGHWCRLFSRGIEWSLVNRIPLHRKIKEAVAFVLQAYSDRISEQRVTPPWMRRSASPNVDARKLKMSFWERISYPPSALSSCLMWESLLETLPSNRAYLGTRFEYLYPYLDKDLVEFLLQVPPERLLQPRRRRFLMRNALRGIVPDQILERRRKAYAIRGPLRSLQEAAPALKILMERSRLAEMNVLDPVAYSESLREVSLGAITKGWSSLIQAVLYEGWLRSFEEADSRSFQIHLS